MDPFIAEIRIFGFGFAPRGWAACDGQILPIQQNTALFSLLGTAYGGTGITTFALPNLTDRSPLGVGQSVVASYYYLGQEGGVASVALQSAEMPSHAHQLNHVGSSATSAAPSFSVGLADAGVAQVYATGAGTNVPMVPNAMMSTGNGLPHNNRSPYLALNFCIALQGIYPSRS